MAEEDDPNNLLLSRTELWRCIEPCFNDDELINACQSFNEESIHTTSSDDELDIIAGVVGQSSAITAAATAGWDDDGVAIVNPSLSTTTTTPKSLGIFENSCDDLLRRFIDARQRISCRIHCKSQRYFHQSCSREVNEKPNRWVLLVDRAHQLITSHPQWAKKIEHCLHQLDEEWILLQENLTPMQIWQDGAQQVFIDIQSDLNEMELCLKHLQGEIPQIKSIQQDAALLNQPHLISQLQMKLQSMQSKLNEQSTIGHSVGRLLDKIHWEFPQMYQAGLIECNALIIDGSATVCWTKLRSLENTCHQLNIDCLEALCFLEQLSTTDLTNHAIKSDKNGIPTTAAAAVTSPSSSSSSSSTSSLTTGTCAATVAAEIVELSLNGANNEINSSSSPIPIIKSTGSNNVDESNDPCLIQAERGRQEESGGGNMNGLVSVSLGRESGLGSDSSLCGISHNHQHHHQQQHHLVETNSQSDFPDPHEPLLPPPLIHDRNHHHYHSQHQHQQHDEDVMNKTTKTEANNKCDSQEEEEAEEAVNFNVPLSDSPRQHNVDCFTSARVADLIQSSSSTTTTSIQQQQHLQQPSNDCYYRLCCTLEDEDLDSLDHDEDDVVDEEEEEDVVEDQVEDDEFWTRSGSCNMTSGIYLIASPNKQPQSQSQAVDSIHQQIRLNENETIVRKSPISLIDYRRHHHSNQIPKSINQRNSPPALVDPAELDNDDDDDTILSTQKTINSSSLCRRPRPALHSYEMSEDSLNTSSHSYQRTPSSTTAALSSREHSNLSQKSIAGAGGGGGTKGAAGVSLIMPKQYVATASPATSGGARRRQSYVQMAEEADRLISLSVTAGASGGVGSSAGVGATGVSVGGNGGGGGTTTICDRSCQTDFLTPVLDGDWRQTSHDEYWDPIQAAYYPVEDSIGEGDTDEDHEKAVQELAYLNWSMEPPLTDEMSLIHQNLRLLRGSKEPCTSSSSLNESQIFLYQQQQRQHRKHYQQQLQQGEDGEEEYNEDSQNFDEPSECISLHELYQHLSNSHDWLLQCYHSLPNSSPTQSCFDTNSSLQQQQQQKSSPTNSSSISTTDLLIENIQHVQALAEGNVNCLQSILNGTIAVLDDNDKKAAAIAALSSSSSPIPIIPLTEINSQASLHVQQLQSRWSHLRILCSRLLCYLNEVSRVRQRAIQIDQLIDFTIQQILEDTQNHQQKQQQQSISPASSSSSLSFPPQLTTFTSPFQQQQQQAQEQDSNAPTTTTAFRLANASSPSKCGNIQILLERKMDLLLNCEKHLQEYKADLFHLQNYLPSIYQHFPLCNNKSDCFDLFCQPQPQPQRKAQPQAQPHSLADYGLHEIDHSNLADWCIRESDRIQQLQQYTQILTIRNQNLKQDLINAIKNCRQISNLCDDCDNILIRQETLLNKVQHSLQLSNLMDKELAQYFAQLKSITHHVKKMEFRLMEARKLRDSVTTALFSPSTILSTTPYISSSPSAVSHFNTKISSLSPIAIGCGIGTGTGGTVSSSTTNNNLPPPPPPSSHSISSNNNTATIILTSTISSTNKPDLLCCENAVPLSSSSPTTASTMAAAASSASAAGGGVDNTTLIWCLHKLNSRIQHTADNADKLLTTARLTFSQLDTIKNNNKQIVSSSSSPRPPSETPTTHPAPPPPSPSTWCHDNNSLSTTTTNNPTTISEAPPLLLLTTTKLEDEQQKLQLSSLSSPSRPPPSSSTLSLSSSSSSSFDHRRRIFVDHKSLFFCVLCLLAAVVCFLGICHWGGHEPGFCLRDVVTIVYPSGLPPF